LASSQLVGLVSVDPTGAYTFFDSARNAAEPSNNLVDIFISTGRQIPSGFGFSADYSVGGSPQRAIVLPYISGSYTKTFYASFGRESGVGPISVIGCGLTGSSTQNSIFAHLINTPQEKASNFILEVYFTYQWGRA
jgi:hypothetical protein